jgi:hypothetical protein
MIRFALAPLAVAVLSGVALAGPIHTWGYQVYSTRGPNPMIAMAYGLTATDVVTISAEDLLRKAVRSPDSPLPDAAGYAGDRYREEFTYGVGVTLTNEQAGFSQSAYRNAYTGGYWRVTRDWTKADTPTGPQWELSGETTLGGTSSNNYTYASNGFGVSWDRYDVRSNTDGSLTLSVTTDVPPDPRATPEPGTLAIAAVGGAGLLAGWLKRRKQIKG